MTAATCLSVATKLLDGAAAAADLAGRMSLHRPRCVFAYCTVGVDAGAFIAALTRAMPGARIIGATTCQQAASDAGAGDTAMALALNGDGFRVGVASGADASSARALGARLAREALRDAGFDAAAARFVVLHVTPGLEEGVLAGIRDVMGSNVPLIGGSAADDDITGKWSCLGGGTALTAGASLLVCDWPWKLSMTFQSGYRATDKRGVVTAADQRRIISIDGRPAADVYDEWTKRTLPIGESILASTALTPLGAVRGTAAGLELHVLVHPEHIDPDRSIHCFAAVDVGETLVLMESTISSLTRRSTAVTNFALTQAQIGVDDVLGELVIYCAGCSLALGGNVGQMVTGLQRHIGAPFVMPFTFGEQGCITRGRVDHGNLMCSALLLTTIDVDTPG
ncbi:MAG: FIST N-terminal domain-containing protein [Deltaproteobacteria bacterium]|nr:FIST N-terminal domain-containing protein [Deltaproteobacteria bacterium]